MIGAIACGVTGAVIGLFACGFVPGIDGWVDGGLLAVTVIATGAATLGAVIGLLMSATRPRAKG